MATNNNDKKISQLPPAEPLTGAELVPIVQNGSNKRITLLDIATLTGGGGSGELLATVARTGSYNDLLDKPQIPDTAVIESDIAGLQNDIIDIQNQINLISSNGNYEEITREIPIGPINGINNIFFLQNAPAIGTEEVYLNGVLQQAGVGGDYTLSENQITFAFAPQTSWTIFVNYSVLTEVGISGASSISTSQLVWSSSEQEFLFEKASDGSTLYCKEIDLGFLTDGSIKSVPHGISNYAPQKVHNISGILFNTVGADSAPLNSMAYGGNFCILDSVNVNVHTPNSDCSSYRCKVRLIYSK